MRKPLSRTILPSTLLLLAGLLAPVAQAELAYTYTSAEATPVADFGYTASGPAVFKLGFAPVPGTSLTVVNNTGLPFIKGQFSNLVQGQVVPLSYQGVTYRFVANYYGGTGNDLVLQWAQNRPAAFGLNSNGQLGDKTMETSSLPEAVLTSGVLAGKTIIAVSVGDYHSLALASDGTVAAWGYNRVGQLGNGTTIDSSVPVKVDTTSEKSALFGKTIIAVSAGATHSLALASDGTIAAWGYNTYGQLGNGTTVDSTLPVKVDTTSERSALFGKTVVAISTGEYHSLALTSDGSVVSWGYNFYGQLGDKQLTNSSIPVAVNFAANAKSTPASQSIIAVSAGAYHSLALTAEGKVMAWGYNSNSQLGTGNTENALAPIEVGADAGASALFGEKVIAISGGQAHSLALTAEGTVIAWGANYAGQLGINSKINSALPVAVDMTSDQSVLLAKKVVSISAGYNHSLALTSDGLLAAWGYNVDGELGNASQVDSLLPVAVLTSELTLGGKVSLASTGPAANHSLLVVPSAPSSDLSVIALTAATGKPVVGAGLPDTGIPVDAKWRLLGFPGQDPITGTPFFRGTFSSPTEGLQAAIFGAGGLTPLLAKTGDVAPGTDGKLFALLSEPVGNAGTAFYGTLAGVAPTLARGLWSNAFPDAAGQLQLVARIGTPVPTLPAAKYTTLTNEVLNTGENLFWNGTFAGAGVKLGTEKALFTMSDVATGPQLVLRTGQRIMIADKPVTVSSFVALDAPKISFGNELPGSLVGYGTGRLDGGALVPGRLVLADSRIALAPLGAGVPIVPVAVTKDLVPSIPGTMWNTLSYPVIAPSGVMAFRGTLAVAPGFKATVPVGTAQVLFTQTLDSKGAILPATLLARQGAAAPQLPELKYAGFSDPYLNRLGDTMFFSLLSGPGVTLANHLALYWAPVGEVTPQLVARTGAPAPGITGAVITSFTGAGLPVTFGEDQPTGPVFTATLQNAPGSRTVTALNNSALWAMDAMGTIQLLARTGTVVDGKILKSIGAFKYVPGSEQQVRTTALGTSVVYLATFTDLTQAVVQLEVPTLKAVASQPVP